MDEILTATRELLAKEGGRINLPRLGVRLRQMLPNYVDLLGPRRSLRRFLAAHPELGRIEIGKVPQDIWLIGQDLADSPSGDRARSDLRLPPGVWKAVTAYEEGDRVWFDLSEERVVTEQAFASQDPDRFLPLPRFAYDAQRGLAKEWIESTPAAAGFSALLDEPRGLSAFVRKLEEVNLAGTWHEWRESRIAAAVGSWCEEHGIAPEHVGEHGAEPTIMARQPRRPVPMRECDLNEDRQVRRFLHAALDEMTLPELLAIPVPARLIVKLLPG